MPTPVSVVRECLTLEASRAVDEAVVVARRRNHAQTTSLHALSAFLSLPSLSLLREAISRVRSSVYSSRIQFKALELCFSVALDRLPSSKSSSNLPDEPPISNSFMAAIKRSQACQRRHPDNYHLNQIQQINQQNQQPIVKVELQQLILSILDDPIVSRVFGEAGFRSYDIKLSIVRPPRVFNSRYPAPLFLCNLTGVGTELGQKGFNFPFSSGISSSGLGSSDGGGDDNCRRIGGILVKKKERNPLLVGVSANEALRCFKEILERERGDVLPEEISGLNFTSIENEVVEFINGNLSEGLLRSKFEELSKLINSSSGPGIVVNYGDLKGLIDENSVENGNFLITQIKKLLEIHHEKLWLIGTAPSYELYLKFIRRFPSVEKEWDLQLLPITSLLPSSMGALGFNSPPPPQSSMESFVPFGGLFSVPSDTRVPICSSDQSISCCNLCNEKYEQEVNSILQGGSSLSVADQYNASLPSWLQTDELTPDKGFDMSKVKDDGAVLNAKVIGLQKKWNDICRRLNHTMSITKAEISRLRPDILPAIEGFPFVVDGQRKIDCSSSIKTSPSKSLGENVLSSTPMGLQKFSASNQNMPLRLVSEGKDDNFVTKINVNAATSECFATLGLSSPACTPTSSGLPSCHTSPATSVTTDLGLGSLYGSTFKDSRNSKSQAHKDRLLDISGCSPSHIGLVSPTISTVPVRSLSYSTPRSSGQFDSSDFKTLCRNLVEKVGRQNEVIYDISEAISHCRIGNGRHRDTSLRRYTWLSFLGPDRDAKRKIALALSEIIFGSKENFIFADLSFEHGSTSSSTIFGCQEMNGYDIKFRGKTVIDYIAEEIRKKPSSVVFIENVDKADLLVRNSLVQAMKTGKFPDLHGREIGINNSIFVVTSEVSNDGKTVSSANKQMKFSEEKILRAEYRQMKILIERVVPETNTICKHSNIYVTSRTFMNKRKLTLNEKDTHHSEIFETTKRACKILNKPLDLNQPAELIEENDESLVNVESNPSSENSESKWEDFFDQVDRSVVFKPFDFDALAGELLNEIDKSFQSKFEPNGASLEIDLKVMEQMLAATWVSENKKAIEDWVKQVLGRSFAEIKQRLQEVPSGSVLKLVVCENLSTEEKVSGICLPARIVLN